MRVSIIQIEKEKDGLIDGYWLQDHTGSLEDAIIKAKGHEQANGGRIQTAIVEQVATTTPMLHGIFYSLKKLN